MSNKWLDTVKQINDKIDERTLFYVSNEIEHGLGLETFVKRYVQVALYEHDFADYKRKKGYEVIIPKNNQVSEMRSSADLLDWVLHKNQIAVPQTEDMVMTFKISRKFEKIAQETGLILLNTSSELNERFERKVSQSRMFREYGISTPKTKLGSLEEFRYEELKKLFGSKLTIQFDRGHTGTSTFFIENQSEYENLQAIFRNRKVRICEYLSGDTFSCNACVSKQGVIIGGLYKQITGIKELTDRPGATVGGTFRHGLNKKALNELRSQIKLLSSMLVASGYLGLFGFDFIVENEKNEVKIIEINARQQMTVAFNSRLNVMNGIMPLNIAHLAVLLDIGLVNYDLEEHNELAMQPFDASQLYLRNKTKEVQIIGSMPLSGEYSFTSPDDPNKTVRFFKSEYLIDKIERDNFILITQKQGRKVKPNGEVARVQILSDFMNDPEVRGKVFTSFAQIENNNI